MTMKTDPKSMTPRELFRMLGGDTPNHEWLEQQSAESLLVAKERCESHWTTVWLLPTHVLSLALGFTAYLTLVALILKSSIPMGFGDWVVLGSVGLVGVTGVSAALWGFVLSVLFSVTGWRQAREVIGLLKPLKTERFLCAEAIEKLEHSARARAFRDTVVSNGRELSIADYRVIQRLAYEDSEARQEKLAKEICLRVHGLTSV